VNISPPLVVKVTVQVLIPLHQLHGVLLQVLPQVLADIKSTQVRRIEVGKHVLETQDLQCELPDHLPTVVLQQPGTD